MILFLDTSSLFKLYHKEADTSILENYWHLSQLKVFVFQNLQKLSLLLRFGRKYVQQKLQK